MKKLRVLYKNPLLPHLEHIGGSKRSNWIDVRASKVKVNGKLVEWGACRLHDSETGKGRDAKCILIEAGDFVQVYLGFALELPEGYEAHLAPRSSTFKNYGFLQTNSVGVVDETYCGDEDEWIQPFHATRDTLIEEFDRVGQFRIIERMEDIEFDEVSTLGHENRGGHGSSGRK